MIYPYKEQLRDAVIDQPFFFTFPYVCYMQMYVYTCASARMTVRTTRRSQSFPLEIQ